MGAYFTLKSTSTSKRLTFGDLRSRLIGILKLKLDNGEFTERGLARISGISQPQVHNLLKGARRLSSESADVLLDAVHLSVLDLLTDSERYPGAEPKASLASSPAQQLPLPIEPAAGPRKNPASALPAHLAASEQAS
jgi:hypothetical protein